jgi:hypothetical protein
VVTCCQRQQRAEQDGGETARAHRLHRIVPAGEPRPWASILAGRPIDRSGRSGLCSAPAAGAGGSERDMAARRGTQPEQEPEHQAVLANLYDLQARLRGDPASLVQPRARARVDAPRATTEPADLVRAAEGRVIALKARLDQLEAELQSISRSLGHRQPDD